MIYNIKQNEFSIKKGPIFANFVWQMRSTERQLSAVGFIRSHAGKQVTIGDTTFKLTDLS
jgi:MoxR-like ATPase